MKANRLQYKLSLGENLPSVAIGGGYLYNDFLDKSQRSWVGFATVSIPLSGWWGGSHDMKRKKLAVRNAENTLQDNSQLLVINMENKWNDMNDAYRRTTLTGKSASRLNQSDRQRKTCACTTTTTAPERPR